MAVVEDDARQVKAYMMAFPCADMPLVRVEDVLDNDLASVKFLFLFVFGHGKIMRSEKQTH